MINTTRIRFAPLALGAFFSAVTARVLFDDVVSGTQPWLMAITPAHTLTAAAMVGAIAAGHFFLPAVRARKVGAGLGLAVLFVATTLYTVTASGMRNAEVAAAKQARAAQIETQRTDAHAKWQVAADDLAAAKRYAATARDAATAECATGKGRKCDGAAITRDAADNLVTKSDSHERLMRAAYDLVPATATSGVGYARLAAMLADLGAGHAGVIERRIAQWQPFLAVLISELAAIVFLGLGLPSATLKTVAGTPVALPAPVAAPLTLVHSAPHGAPHGATSVQRLPLTHPVIAALAADPQRALTNDELAAAMGVTKGEASKRRAEVAIYLTQRRVGRHVMVALML